MQKSLYYNFFFTKCYIMYTRTYRNRFELLVTNLWPIIIYLATIILLGVHASPTNNIWSHPDTSFEKWSNQDFSKRKIQWLKSDLELDAQLFSRWEKFWNIQAHQWISSKRKSHNEFYTSSAKTKYGSNFLFFLGGGGRVINFK